MIPKDRHYPEDSVQCDNCGGTGCANCDDRGPCRRLLLERMRVGGCVMAWSAICNTCKVVMTTTGAWSTLVAELAFQHSAAYGCPAPLVDFQCECGATFQMGQLVAVNAIEQAISFRVWAAEHSHELTPEHRERLVAHLRRIARQAN